MARRNSGTTEPVEAETREHPRLNWPRMFAIWVAATIGCLSFSSYVVVRWLEHQVLTTENWVALVSPLPKQPVVSAALGNYLSAQVVAAVPLEDKISAALPPQAVFLAKPLASQLQSLITRVSTSLAASDTFQTIWTGANRVAMNRLVTTARGQTSPLQKRINDRFNINISDSAGKLRAALGNAANVFPALQPTTQKALQISADLHARPRRIHQVVRTTDTLNTVLPYVILASLLFALALSWRRRRLVIIMVVAVFCLLLIELIALKWGRQQTLDQVRNPANLSAVGYIYDSILAGLKTRIYWVLGALAVIWLLCLAGGPAGWAASLRSFIALDRLKRSRMAGWWQTARTWAAQYKYFLWLGAAVLVLGGMAAFATVSTQVVVNAMLLIVALCSLIYIIATPRSRPQPAL
jgi:hypothetical protein